MFSQRPPMKRRSANARETAPGACSSGAAPRARRGPGGERHGHDADDGERSGDADRFGDGAEHRPEDGAEDRGAEGGSDQLAAPLARRRDGQPGECARPGGRAREALDEPGSAERPGPFGGREREAGDGEEDEPRDDGALRPPARGCEAAGDPAEQCAGAEGGDEQSCAGLGEPELVRVAGNERRERPEQHRVDEDDNRDENQQPTHQATDVTDDRGLKAAGSPEQLQGSSSEETGRSRGPFLLAINSASRWRFRPLLRLTFRLPPTRPPVEPRPTRAPCSLQGGI